MIFSRFTFRLMLRLGFILTTLALLAFLITQTSFYAVTLLVTMVALFQIWALVKYVDRTNKELTRFLNSIRYQDFLQTFSIEHLGSSFADLNEAFDEVITSFRDARSAKETQARYLQALVEHVPVALVTLHGDGKVDLLNNAARRLLNVATVKDIDALDAFGAVFQRDMAQAKAGERQLTRIASDGVERQLIRSTTQITIA
ncbi:MAG: PAS domain-containing protein, partial [Proteobacteria bacterium]|nr:PAS domain-containing protein [Pseudomonadota bacterium]